MVKPLDLFGSGKRQVWGLSGWEVELSDNSILNSLGASISLLLLSSLGFVTQFWLGKLAGAGKSYILLVGFLNAIFLLFTSYCSGDFVQVSQQELSIFSLCAATMF